MKKLLCIILALCTLVLLTACGSKQQEETAAGFKPALDKNTDCKITVAGNYDNFEALEAEFDKFNEFYPNVKLSYVKLDDYNNMLGTVLEGNDKPNIFFSYTWMMGNEKYDSVAAQMEDLSDSALKLDLDCIRSSLINRDAEGRVRIVPQQGLHQPDDGLQSQVLQLSHEHCCLSPVCGNACQKPGCAYACQQSGSLRWRIHASGA